MRKYAVVLAFLLVVSGCGGSSDTATPATTVAPAATQAPTTTVAPTTTAAPTTTVAATTTVVPATTVAPTTTAAPTTTVAATTIVAPTTTVAATTTAAPTTTSASSSLVVSCVLDADQEMILCEAENLPQSGSLKWTSNATTQWQYGPQWDFALGEVSIPAITQVSLENCQE